MRSAAARPRAAASSCSPERRLAGPRSAARPAGPLPAACRGGSVRSARRRPRRSRRPSGWGWIQSERGSSTASAARCSRSAVSRRVAYGSTSRSRSPSARGSATTSRPSISTSPTPCTWPATRPRPGRSRGRRRAGSGKTSFSSGGSTRVLRFIHLNLAEIHFDLGEWERVDEDLRAVGDAGEGVLAAHAHLRRAQLALARGETERGRRRVGPGGGTAQRHPRTPVHRPARRAPG